MGLSLKKDIIHLCMHYSDKSLCFVLVKYPVGNIMKIHCKNTALTEQSKSRIIEMAWEDRTPFEAIQVNYGFTEPEVIKLMKSTLKASSFRMWRQRVTNKKTKHLKLRSSEINHGNCPTQYKQRHK